MDFRRYDDHPDLSCPERSSLNCSVIMEEESDVEQGSSTKREEPSKWWLISAILAIAALAVVAIVIR
ncbi:hypothetical protein Y032_0230g2950 [Ancylostoma ceylanicum]|uniref:Uncharacterized protein n=1 Tax=Ancylostoma ceylanicum TaxID=53326 RepID=A0A016SH00_9BILA|nr:hypothetical protein Y032_0230g2950 [Ancylostoma ceylanicum]